LLGLPALRLKGIYLAIATLAFNVIVEEVTARWEGLTGGNSGLHLKPIELFGMQFDGDASFYYLCLALTVPVHPCPMNLLRSPTGRAFVAIRDSEISASCNGVNLATYKTMSFALSAALTGIAGALYAHKVSFISPEQFTLLQSIELVTIVILGGVGSIHGAVLGAVFVIVPAAADLARQGLPARERRRLRPAGGGFRPGADPVHSFSSRLACTAAAQAAHLVRAVPFYRRGMFPPPEELHEIGTTQMSLLQGRETWKEFISAAWSRWTR